MKLWGSLGVAHSLVDEKSTKHNGSLQPSWKRTHGESMFVRRRLCRGAPESSAEAMWSHGVLSHLTADLGLPLQVGTYELDLVAFTTRIRESSMKTSAHD